MKVKVGERLTALYHDTIGRGEGLEEPSQWGLAFENNRASHGFNKGHIASELNSVPKTLLGVKQYRLPLKCAAIPKRPNEVSLRRGKVFPFLSPFEFFPPF